MLSNCSSDCYRACFPNPAQSTFTSYGAKSPSTNNPDDIGTLQDLARREAELHLAYASHLYGTSSGGTTEAQKQWETGCIRLESFVTDAIQRQEDETRLRAQEAMQSEASGKELAGTLKAASVASSVSSTPFIARLNGMDPESPFVTQRPQSAYIWYKTSEGEKAARGGPTLPPSQPNFSSGPTREPRGMSAMCVESTLCSTSEADPPRVFLPSDQVPRSGAIQACPSHQSTLGSHARATEAASGCVQTSRSGHPRWSRMRRSTRRAIRREPSSSRQREPASTGRSARYC